MATAIVSMKRTLYLDVPEDSSEEELRELAQKEILLPHNALYSANNALARVGIKINGLDLSDWEITNTEYIIDKD